ncbi:putative metal-dependent phosphoesterase TrpH [Methanomicrobium sp. W14]|jgi:predicted metal-dependent phosphoesterase TrpH|uniref:CehA/McbA family metallohydrolase n=1 Tax=Methanomicrobium sp. W14 TaxID=2817839 RepID=UPI001AE8B44D|nr:PHP domain-containing protein [Methanomicrobium sp. W14]MBP2133784.1 putative metal-dependent phosphoesterase TrpH [Methanomicrobium sp. W14]
MLKCDLHVHTNFSRDGESSVEDVLKRAEKAGLDAIAIVDHDTVEGAQYAKTLGGSVLVIPGIEVSTKQGHLLVMGVDKPVPAGLDFYETVRIAREAGGLLILPHPYHQCRHGVARKVKNAIEVVDAVESFNSRYIVGSANKKAGIKARFFGKPCVAGSDAHNCRFVGYGVTKIEAEKNVPSILAAIKAGKTEPGGKMTPLRSYTRQSLKNTKRKIIRRVHRR